MKKLVLCLGLLSTSAFASLQVDESLIESRSNLRETLHSLKELQTSSKLSRFEKKGLLDLSSSITKRYSSLELFAIKSDINELHSQFGVKISVVSDSYRLSQSKDAKPLYQLSSTKIKSIIKKTVDLKSSLQSLRDRASSQIRTLDFTLADTLKKSADLEKIEFLNKFSNELDDLGEAKKARLKLAKDLGLQIERIGGDLQWNPTALEAKTGFSAFELMGLELRKKMNKSIEKYIETLELLQWKYKIIPVIDQEELMYASTFFKFEN